MNKYDGLIERVFVGDYVGYDIKTGAYSSKEDKKTLQELVNRFTNLPTKEKIKSSLDILWASSDDRYCEIVEEEHKKISLFLNAIYGDE